jgi:hypothetical protein
MIDFKLFEHRNRGLLLDLTVFVVNLILIRVVVKLSMNLVQQAEEDVTARIAIGLFFAGLFFLQPLGPVLKRWSFHQRHKEFTLNKPDSLAGCLLFWYMFVYIVMMMLTASAASILLTEALFEQGSVGMSVGIISFLVGTVLAFVNAVIIFRYFLTPKKAPRWKFLTTPRAEVLGDASMFLNVVCFQILWGSVTASAFVWEELMTHPLGRAGSFTDYLGRFILIGVLAIFVYLPPRIFYLVIDQHRKITWLTMLLANLPLILGVVLVSHKPAGGAAAETLSRTKTILARASYTLTAETLYNEYKLDPQAGAKKYSGKYVTVNGRVQSVDIKKGDSLGSDVRMDGGGRLHWVFCRFDDDQTEEMTKLKENQKVTLQGIGEQFWIGGPTLKQCLLVAAQ